MDPKEAVLYGVLPPAVITLVFVIASWQPWKRTGAPAGAWGSALGIGIGYAVADILIRGWHGLLPPGGGLMHPHIALVTALVIAALTFRKSIGARLPISVILTAGASALVLRAGLTNDFGAAIPYVAAATAAGVVMWMCVWSAAHKVRGARIPLMLWAAATGSSLILLQSHNAALAQMSGALAASMGVFILLGWIRPQIPAVLGAIPVYLLVMLGLLIAGRGFIEPWQKTHWALVLAAVAVASPVVTALPLFRKLRPWAVTAAGVLLAFAISAAGLYLTHDGFDFSGFR